MRHKKESIIKFLLSLDRNYNNNKLSVDVSRSCFISSKIASIGENEFINQLSLLETEGIIKVNFRTKNRDLQYYISIDLYEPLLNYFNKKKASRRKTINHILWEFFKFIIPVTISLLALLKAYEIF